MFESFMQTASFETQVLGCLGGYQLLYHRSDWQTPYAARTTPWWGAHIINTIVRSSVFLLVRPYGAVRQEV